MESLSDEKVLSDILFILQKFLGHVYDIPKPLTVLRYIFKILYVHLSNHYFYLTQKLFIFVDQNGLVMNTLEDLIAIEA